MTALTERAAAWRADSSSSVTSGQNSGVGVSSISAGTSPVDVRFFPMPPYNMFQAAGKP